MQKSMEAQRPGNAWFAMTFHPCLGRQDDIQAEICLHRLDGHIARVLFGSRWRNGPARRQRPWAALIGQDGVQGFHFHGLVAVPAADALRFEFAAQAAQRDVAPYGSVHLQQLTTERVWLDYATRQMRLCNSTAFIVLPASQPCPFTLLPKSRRSHALAASSHAPQPNQPALDQPAPPQALL
ncbi:hypothetical protein [Falsiroseomonas sp.]|uniref:hypothetical protein n=1 Tax=Falsiroseomonas sp. TaxID=2870721 RepID=UPI00356192DD